MRIKVFTQSSRWGWLAIFASLSTLLCCALPILLVVLGFGAAVAAFTAHFPWIVTLAEQKVWLFDISGALLAVCALILFSQRKSCPVDPDLAFRCQSAKRWNTRLLWIASIIWSIGFIAAFPLVPLRSWIAG